MKRAKFGKRIGCRGRDTNRSAPPAQNRTCAFTHTASALDKWRQSVPWDKDVGREGAESIGLRLGEHQRHGWDSSVEHAAQSVDKIQKLRGRVLPALRR